MTHPPPPFLSILRKYLESNYGATSIMINVIQGFCLFCTGPSKSFLTHMPLYPFATSEAGPCKRQVNTAVLGS